jgi:nucleoside-diphosphate-sugar epimerase
MSDAADEASSESALIGYTGFVGGNLLRQRSFDACFNSANIDEIAGRSFDLVVCAGAPAEKWKANADPERDSDIIERLTRALEHVNTRKLVLISTVDVFLDPRDVDEESPVPTTGLHAYGRHRRRLEQIAASRFDTHIVRLVGLFGPGLKKNIIYDLLHENQVDRINAQSIFQFYDVGRLWRDIATAVDNELPLVHLPTEPVSVAEVARAAFGIELDTRPATPAAKYDVHTRYSALFGGSGAYIETKPQELAGIARFVAEERQATSA